ncbi:MAG: hydantoinase/oxoprolinase family protein [Deltaproteobacteria bacterium]|nr:MAG: hydantoinase/oxoprolinase family protein [Deltaproteobacteria bacterium]
MIVGLDVGGTHTDVVVLQGKEIVSKVKLLTDEEDLLQTVCFGIFEAIQGLKVQSIERVVVSTTLATNAIVQDKIEPVGVLVASGPGINPWAYEIGNHYYPVNGAVDHRGIEVAPLSDDEVLGIGKELSSKNVRNLALVSKFSVRNPGLELKMGDLLADNFSSVTLGHKLSGHLNFGRRIATAYLNAAVTTISRKFYQATRRCMDKEGIQVPLEILKADGGTMAQEVSGQYAVETILSGPAASVMGTLTFADRTKEEVVLDIGGTTTDIAILVDGVPLLKPLGIRMGGFNTLVRSLRTFSIGVGGDSWVRWERGELKVGPERKGRALAHGGPEPTPTDALITLDLAQGGQKQRAIDGMRRLAERMGKNLEETAEEVVSKTCALILEAVYALVERVNQQPVYTIHELLKGRQVKPSGLIVIGGPAKELAPRLEIMSGWQARVPPNYDVANAIGAAIARTTCEVTVMADTDRRYVIAPEEGYVDKIDWRATKKEVTRIAFNLLRKKALRLGANEDDLEMELLEDHEFKMVKGFYPVGRSIRVRAQVKPGLISPYSEATA